MVLEFKKKKKDKLQKSLIISLITIWCSKLFSFYNINHKLYPNIKQTLLLMSK